MSVRLDIFISVSCGIRTCTTLPTETPIEDISDTTDITAFHTRFMVGPTINQPFHTHPIIKQWTGLFHISPTQIADEINNTPHLNWHAFSKQILQSSGTKRDIITRIRHLCHGGFEFSQRIKDSTHNVLPLFNNRICHTKTYVCLNERVKLIFLWDITTSKSWFTITQYNVECHCVIIHC